MLRVNRVGIARLFSLVCLFRCSVVLFEYYLFSRYADVCFIAMCVVAISFIEFLKRYEDVREIVMPSRAHNFNPYHCYL